MFAFLPKIQISAYFYVDKENLIKMGWSAAELLCIFDLQNGGRPPPWIWYDVITDHPRFMVDGPNILLKLHVDRVYTLQDIVIFLHDGLKIAYSRPYWSRFWG